MKPTALLSVALAAVLSFGCNSNRDVDTHEPAIGTSGAAVSAGDRDFVEDMLHAGMAEVELGRLAMERAASNDVKQFASMMVEDHSRSGDALRQVASQHGIQPPAQLDEQHLDMRTRLSGLQGGEFDREYMNMMVDSHQEVVDRLQTRASEDRFGDDRGAVRPEGSDNPIEASINQWAANTLPTTRHHLEEARRIHDGLGRVQTRR